MSLSKTYFVIMGCVYFIHQYIFYKANHFFSKEQKNEQKNQCYY